jgi:four helix bundle protein
VILDKGLKLPRIQIFEEVESWQAARLLVKEIYALSHAAHFGRDWALRNQIRRAAVSVMSNIAEGFECQSNKILVRHLYIAKGSAGEVRSQLYVCLDLAYINEQEFRSACEQAMRCSRMISGFIKYLERNATREPTNPSPSP